MKIMDLLSKALCVLVVFSFSFLVISADAQAAQKWGTPTTSDPQKKSTPTSEKSPPTPAQSPPPPSQKTPTPGTLPAAPADGPVIEPIIMKVPPMTPPADAGKLPATIAPEVKLPPRTLPVDPTGGLIGDRERQAIEAARAAAAAEKLADQELAIDKVMGAGTPDDDPLMGGAGIQAVDRMEELCKGAQFRRLVRGLGVCPGSDGGALPPDGDPSDFYDTEPQWKPARTPLDEGQTAGGGVPRRDGRASDDGETDQTYERGPDGSTRETWTDGLGRQHILSTAAPGSGDTAYSLHEVYNRDGSFSYSDRYVDRPDRGPDARRGDRIVDNYFKVGSGPEFHTRSYCRGRRCYEQPGEEGRGTRSGPDWEALQHAQFCARNPGHEKCKPKPGVTTYPADPDGEGTPMGQRPTTHRLGRDAVVNPGDILDGGGRRGGGSGPLDMKDPACPEPPCN